MLLPSRQTTPDAGGQLKERRRSVRSPPFVQRLGDPAGGLNAFRHHSQATVTVASRFEAITPRSRIRRLTQGEQSARPSASQKGIRKTSDVASLPNLAVYENQGGAYGAGLSLAEPIRRTSGRAGKDAGQERSYDTSTGRRETASSV